MLEQKKLFIENLPHKPYCTDNLDYGLQIRSAKVALTKRLIQHNKPFGVSWLVFDLDSPHFWSLLESETLPAPNLVSFNLENHHCHIYYSLKTPVCRSSVARRKPLRYLAAIEYALREKWTADAGYTGFISKNPIHPHWETIQFRSEPWELGELADWLTLPKTLPRRGQSVGLGRNCTLFDLLRYWAYDHVLDFRIRGGLKPWSETVLKVAEGFNSFPEPLPTAEVRATAKSVSNWVWKNYTKRWSDEEFSQVQAARGRMSGAKRRHASKEKRAKAHELRADGMTQKAIAKKLSVSDRTIRNWLNAKSGN